MLEFLTLKQEAFGLDFSDLSLKIAKLKKRGKFFSLASWLEVKLKPGIIEEGEIKNESVLIDAIKTGLNNVKGEKLKTKNVIASLPEKKAFLQVIRMPKMEEGELKTAVPFEAENYIPFPIEEVYLDFQIVRPIYGHSDYFEILIVALPKKTIDPYVSCLKKAGLVPRAFEVESQSISRALIKNGTSPFPVLMVDFGRSGTSFIIFLGSSPRFTSSSPISSHKLTEAISQNLNIDLIEGEKLKLKYNLQTSKKTIKDKKVFEAIKPTLNNLVEQIKKYLYYYQTHSASERFGFDMSDGTPGPRRKLLEKIDKILLCGRGANLKGLPDFLSFELKARVELGNPWINILPELLKEIPELSFEESLGYTTALGLALRGIKREYD